MRAVSERPQAPARPETFRFWALEVIKPVGRAQKVKHTAQFTVMASLIGLGASRAVELLFGLS